MSWNVLGLSFTKAISKSLHVSDSLKKEYPISVTYLNLTKHFDQLKYILASSNILNDTLLWNKNVFFFLPFLFKDSNKELYSLSVSPV